MWKLVNKYKTAIAGGEEVIILESSGTNYRLKNEFGNMFFEFDLTSGLFFTQALASDIEADAANEVREYLRKIKSEESVSHVGKNDSDQLNGKDSTDGVV